MSDLHYGRHVHQDGQQNWKDQAHLQKGIQEGTHGDEMLFLPYYFHVKVGGPDSRGLRFSMCYVGDLCDVSNVKKILYSIHSRTPYTFLQPVQGWGYNIEKYREATSKKELCKVDLLSSWGPKKPIEKMRKEYHEYCPKSKSNNIVFCPKEIIKRKSEKVQCINDNFNKTWLKEIILICLFRTLLTKFVISKQVLQFQSWVKVIAE